MEKTYRIPEQNIAKFDAKVACLVKKANKLNVAPITVEHIGEDFEEIEKTDKFRRYVLVRVSGEKPVISGWTFLGSLDIIPTVGTIVRCIPGVTLSPEYHQITESRCDHCHKHIRRINHHIVRNIETSEIKVVGSSCLGDFIGHDVANRLAYCEYLLKIDEEGTVDESWGSSGGSRDYTSLLDYLCYVALATRLNGWVSKKTASEHDYLTSTSDVAANIMFSKEADKEVPNSTDMEHAEKAIEWVRTVLINTASSDYEHNLVTIVKADYVPSRAFGIAASIISAYYRAVGIELSKKYSKVVSQHIGAVGAKITTTVEIEKTYAMDSDYGMRCMYRMRDESGNILVWWASKIVWFDGVELEVGHKLEIKGTVKQLEDYKGIKQTVLTRCKVLKLFAKEG